MAMHGYPATIRANYRAAKVQMQCNIAIYMADASTGDIVDKQIPIALQASVDNQVFSLGTEHHKPTIGTNAWRRARSIATRCNKCGCAAVTIV